MDFFVFPSIFEGLGIVVIEAQANGLICYVSDVIPKEVQITNLVKFLSLKNEFKFWAKEILSVENRKHSNEIIQIQKARYDINSEVKKLKNIYIKLLER